jgi:hypothetical protein
MKNRIGILGSGIVAQTLGNGFLKHGYAVMLGTRSPDKLTEWKANSGGEVGSFEESATFGDMLVLAVKGTVAKEALELSGVDNLKGKTIFDATNPISEEGPEDGVLRFFTDINHSLLEQLQASFPDGNFVKCFSCVGAHYMVNPELPGGPPSMFIAGNSEDAKKDVTAVLLKFGWDVEDMGTAKGARGIEPLCILWCTPGFRENRWTHAFKLLKV